MTTLEKLVRQADHKFKELHQLISIDKPDEVTLMRIAKLAGEVRQDAEEIADETINFSRSQSKPLSYVKLASSLGMAVNTVRARENSLGGKND